MLPLSPSSAERWSHCPGSEFIIRRLPRLPSTQAADEGTLAHTFAAWAIASTLRDVCDVEPVNGMPEEPQHALATDEMLNAAQVYADAIFSKLCAIAPDFAAQNFEYGVEAECLAISESVEIRGRIDFYAKVGGHLVVADFKYGGMPVPAAGNKQMSSYAYCLGDKIKQGVSMGIIQPRSEMSDFSEFGAVWKDYTADEFSAFMQPLLDRAAEACAADEKTQRAVGDWCKFCAARSVCRAAIGEKLLLAGIAAGESEMAQDATNEQIGAWLDALKDIENAREDLTRIAKARIQNGETVPGWRLQNRKSMQWSEDVTKAGSVEAQADKIQEITGLNAENFIKKQIRTVADVKKTIAIDELKSSVESVASTALIKAK